MGRTCILTWQPICISKHVLDNYAPEYGRARDVANATWRKATIWHKVFPFSKDWKDEKFKNINSLGRKISRQRSSKFLSKMLYLFIVMWCLCFSRANQVSTRLMIGNEVHSQHRVLAHCKQVELLWFRARISGRTTVASRGMLSWTVWPKMTDWGAWCLPVSFGFDSASLVWPAGHSQIQKLRVLPSNCVNELKFHRLNCR